MDEKLEEQSVNKASEASLAKKSQSVKLKPKYKLNDLDKKKIPDGFQRMDECHQHCSINEINAETTLGKTLALWNQKGDLLISLNDEFIITKFKDKFEEKGCRASGWICSVNWSYQNSKYSVVFKNMYIYSASGRRTGAMIVKKNSKVIVEQEVSYN